MNPHKLRAILGMIQAKGKLPRDQWDEVFSPDDLLVWFDLDGRLSPDEEEIVKGELAMMAEAETFMDHLHCKLL